MQLSFSFSLFVTHPIFCFLVGSELGGSAVWGFLGFALLLPFFFFSMALPLEKTIDIRCTGFPAGTLQSEVVKYINAYFEVESQHRVVSIQECPGRIARVTFTEGVAKFFFEEQGSVVLNGVECSVRRPSPFPPSSLILWFLGTLMSGQMMRWLPLCQGIG